MKNILVIGTGYVGLITGVSLSEIGHKVTCLDVDQRKIDMLSNGKTPIYELGLNDYLDKNLKNKRLNFTTDFQESVKNSQIIYIAVGTPEKEDGSANLDYLISALSSIKANLNSSKILVIKSTVPVGTAQMVKEFFEDSPYEISVISNPEFLREGSAIYDAFNGDRIVIGGENVQAISTLEEVNKPFGTEVYKTTNESAEMIKYASNAFLATKISFINEIANICEKVGADVNQVATGMGMDKRIGEKFLKAGIGYGGSCFPKDTKALAVLARQNNIKPIIIDSVIERNEMQKLSIVEKYLANTKFNGSSVGILGLAFKPNTDDMREAPSISIIKELIERDIKVYAYDPISYENAEELIGEHVEMVESASELLTKVNVVFLVTEWDEFKNLNFVENKEYELYDGRNFINKENLNDKVEYYGIGI